MIFVLAAVILLFIIIILFAFPHFSPIPYYPTNSQDVKKIITAFELKKNQTIIDLGAGDGKIIFAGAKFAKQNQLNTKFVAIEINPILVVILKLKQLFHSNQKNIQIVLGDIFTLDYKLLSPNSKLTTYYFYSSPRFINTLAKKINHARRIVSYMYPVIPLRKKQQIVRGKNKIYIYNKI